MRRPPKNGGLPTMASKPGEVLWKTSGISSGQWNGRRAPPLGESFARSLAARLASAGHEFGRTFTIDAALDQFEAALP